MSGWSELVTTALLGTDRREIPTVLPEDLAPLASRVASTDPAGRLLDIAAGYSAYTRAGAVAESCPPPAVAPPATQEPAPPQAQQVLHSLVAMRGPLLVNEWLQVCVDHGRYVPPPAWTSLADLAATASGVDAPLLRLAMGARGLWFLGHNDRWRRLVDAPGEPSDVGDGHSAVTSLVTARTEGEARAGEELDTSWSTLRAAGKVALLDAMSAGLTEGDEPILLRALRDRSTEVRETAARLISRLPESGYARRMTERATSAVIVTRSLGRHRVVVTPPVPDDAMSRDGVTDKPPRSFPGGPAAFVLRQILAATPLSVWTPATRLAASDLVEVTDRTASDWAGDLRAGWALAAVRQADAGWAQALLEAGEVDEALVALVPSPERVDVALRWMQHRVDATRVGDLVLSCPRPWPVEITETALELVSSGRLGHDAARFADKAGHAMHLGSYATLERHVLGWTPPKQMTAHLATEIRRAHARMEELLATRIAIHQSFTADPTAVRRFAVPHFP